jgi:hypothetical protein
VRKLLCLMASLLIVAPLVFGAGAVPSGVPSNLKVKTLTTKAAGEQVRLVSGATNAFIAFFDPTNTTRRGFIENNETFSQLNLYTEGLWDLSLGVGGTSKLRIDHATGQVSVLAPLSVTGALTGNSAAITGTVDAGTLSQAGVPACLSSGLHCPSQKRIEWLYWNAAGVAQASSSGVSVTRNSLGNYTVTFSPTFNSVPACACTTTGAGPGAICTASGSFGSGAMQFVTSSSGSTLADQTTMVHCVGN